MASTLSIVDIRDDMLSKELTRALHIPQHSLIGLTLAILLEMAGTPYDIFERGLEARTVGKG
jgi:hypothetical protein